MTFKRNDATSIDGTSFHDTCVSCSLETMVRLFGEPGPGDGGYKTRHEWIFEGPDGGVAVYDYRYDGSVSGYWHVGAADLRESQAFARWFKAQVAAA